MKGRGCVQNDAPLGGNEQGFSKGGEIGQYSSRSTDG